ncbi:MAG: hypothetical protein ACRCS7_07325 [Tannerellaceae bacterium]
MKLFMKNKDDIFKQFQNSFNGLHGHFHVLERSVSVEEQMKYFKYSESLKRERAQIDIDSSALVLADLEESLDNKRKALVALASSINAQAYRILEDYSKNPDEELRDWSQLALLECKIALESELSEEQQIFISTGLGGKNEKLRFFVLVKTKDKHPLVKYQEDIVLHEFEYALKKNGCELEDFKIATNFFKMVVLVPIGCNIKGIFDSIINECNQYGDFLSSVYTVTNVKILDDEEIAKIIDRDGDNKSNTKASS